MKRFTKLSLLFAVGALLLFGSCSKKGTANNGGKRIKSNCGCPHF